MYLHVKLFIALVTVLAFAVVFFYDLRVLQWRTKNLLRFVFQNALERERRDLVHRYVESVQVIDLFAAAYAGGLIAPDARDAVGQRLSTARYVLCTLLQDLVGPQQRRWLAEHLRFREVPGGSKVTIAELALFLKEERELLSDAPHAIDEHTERLWKRSMTILAKTPSK